MTQGSKLPTELSFHYIKSAQFRTIHADGLIGGITPRGLVHLAIYSERPAIPQLVVQEISPEGKLGKEVSRVGKEGVARELEVDILVDDQVAQSLYDWLGERLKELAAVKTELAKRAGTT